MSTTLSRRAVLQLVGGSALGMLFTPLPWKVLDDVSIWTQNWPWIPKGAAGAISYAGATCTLCQAACGMRARMAGPQPISLAGMPMHPFNGGALCTAGILAHHLRYHPARVKQAVTHTAAAGHATPISSATALDEISRIMKDSGTAGPIAIVDSRPGRTASSLFRMIGDAAPAVRVCETASPSLDVLAAMADTKTGGATGPLGYDIDGATFILNFGAPMFDNWGTPARASRLLDTRGAKSQTIIHIEAMCSRSAERSTQWIAARPGSETLLALGLANVIIEEKLYSPGAARSIADLADFSAFVRTFTPEAVSKAAGVTPETIRTTARSFASGSASVAVIGGDASADARNAVMALNVLVGAVGRTGGVVLRRDVPTAAPRSSRATAFEEIPDHSLRAVILDESLSGCMIPDAMLERKLVRNSGVIISLSPFVTPRTFCTQHVIPASVMFETLTDVPGPIDSSVSSLALATAVLPAPENTMDAVQFALALAAALGVSIAASGTTEEIVKQRCASVHASKRGSVFAPSTGETTPVKSLASADVLWSALAEGGCWMDEPSQGARVSASYRLMKPFAAAPVTLPKTLEAGMLVVLPFAGMNVYEGASVSPLMNKVSQESGLRLGLHQAYVNPATALAAEIANGDAVTLTTARGSMNVQAKVDAAVMPDVIFVSTTGAGAASGSAVQGRDIRVLCDMSAHGSFSPTPVSLQKVLA